MVYRVLWRNMQQIKPGTPGWTPSLYDIGALGSFTCITQHTEPTVLRPIRRTKHGLVSCLRAQVSGLSTPKQKDQSLSPVLLSALISRQPLSYGPLGCYRDCLDFVPISLLVIFLSLDCIFVLGTKVTSFSRHLRELGSSLKGNLKALVPSERYFLRKRQFFTHLNNKNSRPETFYFCMHLKAHKVVQQWCFFFLSLFSCNFDDQVLTGFLFYA